MLEIFGSTFDSKWSGTAVYYTTDRRVARVVGASLPQQSSRLHIKKCCISKNVWRLK